MSEEIIITHYFLPPGEDRLVKSLEALLQFAWPELEAYHAISTLTVEGMIRGAYLRPLYAENGGFKPDVGLLTLHPVYRGHGLGRILFQEHLDWLYASGLTAIPIKPENPLVERIAHAYAEERSYEQISSEGRIIIVKK